MANSAAGQLRVGETQVREMNSRKVAPFAMLLVPVMLIAGCRSNPAFRKQKYFESGQRFSAEGKYREASLQFLNALKVDEDYPAAHFELAHAYEHMGQFAFALEELERTVEVEPTNLTARVDLGNLLLASGRVADAQAQANAVLSAQADNAGALALLSAVSSRNGEDEKALAAIRRAIELDPYRAVFHENLGLLLANSPGTFSLAEAEFRKAIELDPGSTNARLLLASYFARGNRLVEAERAAWEAVAVDPHSLAARADVAQIILKEGDWARTEQVLRQASKDLADTSQGAGILADYYADTQQFDKAKREFSTQLAEFPKNTTLQKGYIRVLIQMKDFATSRVLLSGLMKNSPRDPEVSALNGIMLLNDGNANEAANALREGARALPQDAFIQFWLGKAAQAKGEVNVAEISFRQAAQLNPMARAPLEELAGIASQHGDDLLLRDVANRAITAMPGIPDGYIWRGIVERDNGDLAAAEADLNSAIKIAPESSQAYLQMGKLRFMQKRFSEGVSLVEQALQYDPNSAPALHLLADCDVFQKHPERATARVNAQIQKNPRNNSFYDILAQLQLQDKKFDEASASAQKALQLDPSDGEAVSLFAQIAESDGRIEQAVDAWLKWSNTHPGDGGALAVLGTLEESRGNLQAAESYYRKALQVQPRQPIAANNLAYRMLQNKQALDVALSLAETAREAMPDSPNTADTLAWAYYHKGTYQLARDLLESAINNDPDSAALHYHLAMVYSKLSDKKNATLHLKKALSLPHDANLNDEANAALKNLG